jgi:hypothetical protein
MIDARVSNGHQVQTDVGLASDSPYLAHFLSQWKKAMHQWLTEAGPGDLFIFRPELGPPPYAIVQSKGGEISDRWAQAIRFAQIGKRLWNECVREAGRGLIHRHAI